jgi:hypothetical protein
MGSLIGILGINYRSSRKVVVFSLFDGDMYIKESTRLEFQMKLAM